MFKTRQSFAALSLLLLIHCPSVCATDVDTLLEEKHAPDGVVFEIVSDDEGLLEDLLPSVKSDIDKLQARFPGLPIAIVTHGKEQFDLTVKNQSAAPRTHTLVKQLTESDVVDVHVCGTHAGWYGVTPEAFPDYVDVTAAAPTLIDDYEEMGYEVIVLTE